MVYIVGLFVLCSQNAFWKTFIKYITHGGGGAVVQPQYYLTTSNNKENPLTFGVILNQFELNISLF